MMQRCIGHIVDAYGQTRIGTSGGNRWGGLVELGRRVGVVILNSGRGRTAQAKRSTAEPCQGGSDPLVLGCKGFIGGFGYRLPLIYIV